MKCFYSNPIKHTIMLILILLFQSCANGSGEFEFYGETIRDSKTKKEVLDLTQYDFYDSKTDYKIASEGSNIFVILRKGSGEAFVFIKDLQCGLYVIYPIDFGRRETDVQIEQEKISDGQPAFIVSTWCGNKAFAFLPRQEGDYAQMDLIRRDEMASGRYSIATPENPELYAFAVWKENGTYGYVFLRNNDKENTEKEVDYFKHEVAKPVDSSLYIETSVTDDPAQGFTCYHGKYRYEAVPICTFYPTGMVQSMSH